MNKLLETVIYIGIASALYFGKATSFKPEGLSIAEQPAIATLPETVITEVKPEVVVSKAESEKLLDAVKLAMPEGTKFNPFNEPKASPAPEPDDRAGVKFTGSAPARINSKVEGGDVSTITVDKYSISYVNSMAGSFWETAKLADSIGDSESDSKILRDTHTNANGKDPRPDGYGFLILSNSAATEYGQHLCREYKKIYDEKGWLYQTACPVSTAKQHTLGFLNQANQRGLAAVIDEFCFLDDPKNGDKIVKWTSSEEGHKRLAEARFNALLSSKFTHEINFAGHHRDKSHGYYGASFDGKHETDIAFGQFSYAWNHFQNAGDNIVAQATDTEVAPIQDPFWQENQRGGYLVYASGRIFNSRKGWVTKPKPKPKRSYSTNRTSRSYASRSYKSYPKKSWSTKRSYTPKKSWSSKKSYTPKKSYTSNYKSYSKPSYKSYTPSYKSRSSSSSSSKKA